LLYLNHSLSQAFNYPAALFNVTEKNFDESLLEPRCTNIDPLCSRGAAADGATG
jgi:hypothetical protein